jgi:hypothetical protein
MTIGQIVALFFGGMFGMNAIPHVVAGALGRAFQSPFATPSGEGLSSSTVNVAWGFANLVAAWLLLVPVAGFEPHAWTHMLAFGLGALLMALFHARHFGRFHGGRAPE